MIKAYDTIVIGGGFYGLRIAQFLSEEIGQKNVMVIEKENQVMSRASYNNQARVHSGYHYPRSILTALRSWVNAPIFSKEYAPAIVADFTKYYVVARNFSKVSAQQFRRFYERIGAPITPEPGAKKYFNDKMIDEIFRVEEHAFDSQILKSMLLSKLAALKISLKTAEPVAKVAGSGGLIKVVTTKGQYRARQVLNTTYSSINLVNKNSGLEIIPFKHELAEMCLIELPEAMRDKSFTMMCGPFFSIMPFPAKQLSTLSHVRYTPHSEWYDGAAGVRDSHQYLKEIARRSHFPQMLADLKRYMPELADKIKYSGESLWEVKTVLPSSEQDDSRPILYKQDHGGLANYTCIMGGKIDNIYDVFKELKLTYAKAAR